MSNLRVLEKKEGREYVWNYSAAKDILESYYSEAKRIGKARKFKIYEEISGVCCISFDAVKNWFSMKNGPGDIEQVKKMAEYFNVEYLKLLKPLKGGAVMTEELFDRVDMYEELEEYADALEILSSANSLLPQNDSVNTSRA